MTANTVATLLSVVRAVLASNRQHLSSDDCLEDTSEDYQYWTSAGREPRNK